MQPEIQLEKLHELMTVLNRGNATNKDVAEVAKNILTVVANLEKNTTAQMNSLQGESSAATKELRADLKRLVEKGTLLDRRLSDSESKLTKDIDALVLEIFKEIKRIEALIPTLPDLTPLEEMIRDVEKRIPVIPKPLTAEAIRNSLETLEDEERLDASAIKNLPKMVQREAKTIVGGSSGVKGITEGTNIGVSSDPTYAGYKKITLDIPIQPTPPANPVLNMLWIDNS